jgi:hypothetical protein
MSTLSTIALAGILSLVHPTAQRDINRLSTVAADIALAVDMAPSLPFSGPAAREATALALVAIAGHESGFQARYATCASTGDRLAHHGPAEGRSISLWQLMRGWAWGEYSRAEICPETPTDSRPLAAWLALRVLRLHGARCRRVQSWFNGYAAGDCSVRSAAATRQCASWERLMRRAGLAGSCWSTGVVAPVSPPKVPKVSTEAVVDDH